MSEFMFSSLNQLQKNQNIKVNNSKYVPNNCTMYGCFFTPLEEKTSHLFQSEENQFRTKETEN